MIKLLAAAYDDGYAMVETSTGLFCIRPPFSQSQKQRVSAEMVQKAISEHGFSSADEQFDDWAGIIDFLAQKLVESRKAAGIDEPNTERIRTLLQIAPESKVREFIDRVERELIPIGKFQQGIEILARLMKNKLVQSDSSLQMKCLDLIELCNKTNSTHKTTKLGWLNGPQAKAFQFPRLARKEMGKVSNLACQIRDAHQLQAVGSL